MPYGNTVTGDVAHVTGLLTNAVSGTYNAVYGYLQTGGSAASTGTIAPVWGQVEHNGAGTVTNAYGVLARSAT